MRAGSVTGLMSPNPTVVNVVTVKYRPSVRLKVSLNAPCCSASTVQYADANTTRKSGRPRTSMRTGPHERAARGEDPADLDHHHRQKHQATEEQHRARQGQRPV